MTLILSLGNSEQFIQVSDRRLSWNGQLVEDESNKAGLLTCIDARLAFGFSGLSRFARFVTRDWLLDAIYESGPPDYSSANILKRLKTRASDTFKNNAFLRKAPQKDKRISILFSGYLYHHDPPLLVNSIITNFQDCEAGIDDAESWEGFKIYFFTEKVNPRPNNPTIVQRIGNWRAMNQSDELILRNLLEAKKPTSAIIGTAIELIREMADRPTAQGAIGKQLSTICIYPNPNSDVKTQYYSNVNKYKIYMPDSVMLLGDTNRLCLKGFEMQPVDKISGPMVVPKVGRNHPCPCGSGKKYKYCHGKVR